MRRFESSLESGSTIDALWTVTPAKGPAKSGRSVVNEAAQSRDPAGIAAAHSRALGRLSKEIAGAILWLCTGSPPTLNGAILDINDGVFAR